MVVVENPVFSRSSFSVGRIQRGEIQWLVGPVSGNDSEHRFGLGCSQFQPLNRKQMDILSALTIEAEEFLQIILPF